MDLINCKKKRNDPMPYQCEICGNCGAVRKDKRDISNAENNSCFALKIWPHNNTPRTEMYRPFTNSKKEIALTCNNFSHMRILRVR